MNKFRLKFALTDGRKVYATTRGKFDLVEAGALESPSIGSLIDHGAYTQTLSMWFDPSIGSQPDYVPITSAELEPEGSPVDKTAFILGGKKATEI